MQNIHISWSGDDQMREAIRERAHLLLRHLTDEHWGDVCAWVHVHENLLRGKVPVTRDELLLLAVFEADFVVIVDASFVNIRELIFMYDHEKVPHTELPVKIDDILKNM